MHNNIYIISYDLKNPGQNYEKLLKRIKAYPLWARLGGSAYLIGTPATASDIRNYLIQVLDYNDQLFVGSAPAPSAWHGLPEDVSNWIRTNQK